jgi:carbonic anhydrase/acetyltransferase-like protein (isoleucine patch superfamily)
VLKGSTIGDRCIIGAGAVVLENSVIPSECVVVGVPALVIRRLSPASLKRGELKECDCVVLDSSDLRESVIAKPCKEHF